MDLLTVEGADLEDLHTIVDPLLLRTVNLPETALLLTVALLFFGIAQSPFLTIRYHKCTSSAQLSSLRKSSVTSRYVCDDALHVCIQPLRAWQSIKNWDF